MTRARVFLALLLSFSLISAPTFAAVKAGAKCTKAGATALAGGKKFTCVKSGTRLVWNKGVTVKVASKPSSTPVAKPVEPTSTPTPTTTSSVPPKTSDPFAVYGSDAARFKAVDEYGAKIVASRKKDVASLISILETPNDAAVIRMTQNAQFAYSVYEQFMPLGFAPKWIVGESENWLRSQLKDCPNMAANLRPNSGGATCRLTLVWRATNVRDDADTRNLMLVQGGHEIFHLYQQELWGQYWAVTPDWLREGSASLGMGIILTHFEDRKFFPEYGAAQKVERSPKDRNSCEAALDKWEKNESAQGFGFNNGCEYGLGLLMNEFLIMKGHTLKDTLDLVKLTGTGINFPTAFQQVYKISMAEYFKQLRAYLKTLNYGW
jgi:hypothetical protein